MTRPLLLKKTWLALLMVGLAGCSRGPTIEVVLKSQHGEAQADAPVIEKRLEALGLKVVRTEAKSSKELSLQLRTTKEAQVDVDTALSTVTQPWRFDLAAVPEDQSPVQPSQAESSAPAGLQLGEDAFTGKRAYFAPSPEALQPVLQRMQVPAGHEVIIECRKEEAANETRCMPLLVEKPAMAAISLKRAEVNISHLNEPEVNITFSPRDARGFEELTTAQLGKRLALIVDGRAIMVPRISESISGGQARITPGLRTGSFEEQRKEAHTLAQMLRSGSLRGPWEKASVRQLP